MRVCDLCAASLSRQERRRRYRTLLVVEARVKGGSALAPDGEGQSVLVTGGLGFIGSHFVRQLQAFSPQARVVVLDLMTYAADPDNLGPLWPAGPAQELSFPYGHELPAADGLTVVRGDVADGELVRRLFARWRFAAVVHFAAESHVDRSILDAAPFIRTNVEGTRVVLEAARESAVERFIQVSTDEVYGDRDGLEPATEAAALRPSSPYAASKAAADLLALAYHRTFGLPVIITRSCNNYGPHQFPEKLVPLMIWKAASGEPLPVYGDGQQRREWLYVEDNAAAILGVLARGRPGQVYNVGSGHTLTNLEMVEAICRHVAARTGRAPEGVLRQVSFVTDRPGHDRLYAMVSEKVRRETGWAAVTPLAEGLGRTVEWYLGRLDKVRQGVWGAQRDYFRAVYEAGWRGAPASEGGTRS